MRQYKVILEHLKTAETMVIDIVQESAFEAHTVVKNLYPQHHAVSITYRQLY